MTKVKVLIEGYAKELKTGWVASSSVTLIQANGKNIIVDPGCNRKKLLSALKKEGLRPNGINFILLTHSHADHTLLAGIFEKAKVLTTEEIYNNDHQVTHDNKIPGTNLKIIKTSGHCPEHCSLVAISGEDIYVVAGDVFWWTNDEKQTINVNKKDEAHPVEVNMKKLKDSRKKILKIADYIIPGHGKMFKVKK